jgi:REP element-mobilizing transposase RayT
MGKASGSDIRPAANGETGTGLSPVPDAARTGRDRAQPGRLCHLPRTPSESRASVPIAENGERGTCVSPVQDAARTGRDRAQPGRLCHLPDPLPQGGDDVPIAENGERGTGVPPVQDALQPFSPFLPLDVTERNLPHWRQDGATYFVTFRLSDSVPQAKLARWRREQRSWLTANPQPWSEAQQEEYSRRFPQRIEAWLDAGEGSCVLENPVAGEVVQAAMTYFDGSRYLLDQYVVMPNHVHAILTPTLDHTLSEILQSWKSFSAHEINTLLGREGRLWMDESFDHIVRTERQLLFYRNYIRENPRKARLARTAFRVGRGTGLGSAGIGHSRDGVPPSSDPIAKRRQRPHR